MEASEIPRAITIKDIDRFHRFTGACVDLIVLPHDYQNEAVKVARERSRHKKTQREAVDDHRAAHLIKHWPS